MSQQIDVEKDPFLILLTDALRAGPGSPQWHQAVAELKTAGENVDEYRLLIEAREALESGRDYRSVRAGAGFTRKLLNQIDDDPSPTGGAKRRWSTPTPIVLVSALVIAAVVAIVALQLYPHGESGTNGKAVDELATTLLPNEVVSSTFDAGIPIAWRKIGSLPLLTDNGLAPGAPPADPGTYAGGGVVNTEALAPDQAYAVQATLHTSGNHADVIPQVFVSDSNDFSADRGTSAGELVWELQGGRQSVVVNGQVARQAELGAHPATINVRIVFKKDVAIVEADGQRLWAGPTKLADKPRYVGVRFLEPGGKPAEAVGVTSLRILKN